MRVSVTQRQKDWAERRVAEGRYSRIDELICDLMRRKRDEEAQVAKHR